jgi:hypothetical protein
VSRPEASPRPPATGPLGALLLDVLLVLVFAAVGRGSHGEDVVVGLVGTAWPFLLGLLAGWLIAVPVSRGRLRGRSVVPTGLLVWAATLVVGMTARALAGQGVAVSFVIVAGVVLALFLIGLRVLAAVLTRRPARHRS